MNVTWTPSGAGRRESYETPGEAWYTGRSERGDRGRMSTVGFFARTNPILMQRRGVLGKCSDMKPQAGASASASGMRNLV